MSAKPFVKWAGGKRKLIPQILNIMPKKFKAYHEPMVGGGALFFELAPDSAHLNDLNSELIETYTAVKNDPEALIKALKKLKNTQSDYLKVRATKVRSAISKAARFIYLNKLCFNGLYRVNADGIFNVPYCKDETKNHVEEQVIREASKVLQTANLTNHNYLEALTKVKAKDLVFIDPPYDGTFSSYTSSGFNKADQAQLKEALDYLTEVKAYAIICNSDTPFIRDLYKSYTKIPIQDRFVISSKGSSRQLTPTFFITNYDL